MTTRALFTITTIALILGVLVVALCYFFVDQPVAQFVHDHRIVSQELLLWPRVVSGCISAAAAVAIVLVIAWRLWKKAGWLQTVLLAISVDLLAIHLLIKPCAKWACGRYWPETRGRPNWIGSGEYGFHPFHFGPAYGSFPSGHAMVVFSVAAVLWFSYPRWRWCYVLACAAMCAALVGLNYHFVGDVVGGGVLGSIIGVCVWYAFQRADRGPGPSG